MFPEGQAIWADLSETFLPGSSKQFAGDQAHDQQIGPLNKKDA
jgi:hypothetical protein